MKYRCAACDHVFELEGSGKPRCPKCMGIHDIEPVSERGAAPSRRRSRLLPAVLVLLAGAAAFAYFLIPREGEEATEEVAPADLAEIIERAGVAPEEAASPFAATDAIREFAEGAADGEDGAEALGAIVDLLGAWRKEGRWAPHHQREPRREPPLRAGKVLERIEKEGGGEPWRAVSYELACLLLASARSLGIDGRMVQIHSFESEKTPADGGGKLGRWGVSIGAGDGESAPPIFDPWGLRWGESAKADADVLSDEEAAAPFFHLESLSFLVERDTAAALARNDVAVALAPKMAILRTGRGLIFAASGAPTEAIAEFEKAVKWRPDAVGRVNLAEVLLLVDPTGERAETETQAALAEMPDYSRAHAVLAMAHMMRRRYEEAEVELALAERLDPGSPVVAMFWAQLHAAQHQGEEAIAKAKEAVRLSGESLPSLLSLAGIYRATARFDEMRATLDRVLAMAGSEGIAREIRELFGYDPSEEEEVDAGLADIGAGIADGGALELKLGTGKSGLLGGKGPSLGERLGPGLGGRDLELDIDLNTP